MATLVNSAFTQHFSGASFTSMATAATSLTAGNLQVVVARNLTGSISISDTAGNTFTLDKSPSGSGDDHVWSCPNCLGHASNVVTVTYASGAFTSLYVMQFDGVPTGIRLVRLDQNYIASGADVSCVSNPPTGSDQNQIVVVGSQVTNSRSGTVISPGSLTHLAGSSADGHPTGHGSDDVWYNINTTRAFSGTTVDALYNNEFGNWSNAKSIFVAIYGAVFFVPVTTPLAAQTPCMPQAIVGNGGRGQAGCNVGGVGGGHQYAGALGDVPIHTDPDDGEILNGFPDVTLDAWLELDHVDYPTEVITTYRRAFEELGDISTYEGGRKESGLLAVGTIEHALSNEQGGFEAATVDLGLSDVRDRLIRDLSEDQDLDLDEFRIKLASEQARATGIVPRTLLRGVVQSSTLESLLKARLSGVDWLFSDFGPFGPTRQDPNWTFGDLGGAAPDMTSDTKEQAIPLLYGEKSDEGAVDPATGLPASKGLIPGFYLGMFDLAGEDVPDTGPAPGKTLAEVVAELQASVDANTAVADWGGIIGVADAQALQDMGTVPTGYTELAQVIGYADLDVLLSMGETDAPTDTTWGFLATGLGAWFSYTGIYGSDLGNGDALKVRDRVKLDPTARVDVLVPGINFPFALPYFDLTNPDTGRTFRLTGVFLRGPLLDDHLNGVVTFACNAVGIEEIGDGSGDPIMRAEDMKQHRLENHWIDQYSSGLYADTVTFPQFGDGVPKVRSSSFLIRQNYFKTQLGGEGLLISEYADQPRATLDVVRSWNRDTESRLGVNQHGQVVDWGFDEAVDTAVWPRMDAVLDIFGTIVRTAGEERENVVTGSCDWDADFSKYRTGPLVFSSAAGIQKYKNRIKQGDPLESQVLDDADFLSWVLQRRLARLQFGTTLIDVTVRLNPWANYDVGDGVLLTSEDGPGPEGYVDHPFIILRRSLDIVQGLMTFTLWDVQALIAIFSGSPASIPVQDIVFSSVGGEIIYADDTGETVYADAG